MKLWTIHCPKCKVLEKKLKEKKYEFEIIDDPNKIRAEGMDLMPVLELDSGARLNFSDAVAWINRK